MTKNKVQQTTGWLDNYNDSKVTLPKGFNGEGYASYNWKSPAWGGQFEDGGDILLNNGQTPNILKRFLKGDYEDSPRNVMLTDPQLPDFYSTPLRYPQYKYADIGPIYKELPLKRTNLFGGIGDVLTGAIDIYKEEKDINSSTYPERRREDYEREKRKTLGINKISDSVVNPWLEMGGLIPKDIELQQIRYGAPSEGLYAKKTMPSAQNGQEMSFYQQGLDFEPKTISRDGSEIPKFQPGGMMFVPGDQQLQVAAQTLGIFGEAMSAPQKGITHLATGKYQTPSEAMDIQNPWGQFAVDAILDPVNLFGGAGITNKMAPKFLAKAEKLALQKMKAGTEHGIGITQGLTDIYKGRPIFETFPVTASQKANITVKQDEAVKEGVDFVNKWFYDPNKYGPLRPEVKLRIENIQDNTPYGWDNTSQLDQFNPLGNSKNLLVSSRSKDLEKQGLSQSNLEYIRENRGTIAGFNDNENAYTLRNYGLYHRSPESIRNTVMHEMGHTTENLTTKGTPWKEGMTTSNPRFPYYSANLDTPVGQQFGEAMVAPKPGQYLWEGSPSELYAESFPARYRVVEKMKQQLGATTDQAIQAMQWDPERTAGATLRLGKFDRFFKKGTTNEQKLEILKLLPAAVPVAIGAAAQKQRDGGVTKDNMGYWNPDNWGHPVEINSNQITMQGVNEPLLGISDTGDKKMMLPGKDYKFKGKKVQEFPVSKNGNALTRLDQLTNFTNYNTKQPGGWLDKWKY